MNIAQDDQFPQAESPSILAAPAAETAERDGLMGRIGEDVSVWWGEQTERGQRLRRFGCSVLFCATQGADRGRATVFLLPTAFDETLELSAQHGLNGYAQAGLAGAAVGGTFGAWGWLVGRSMHTSMNAFPETTQTIADNHPAMVDVVGGAVNGFLTKEELEDRFPEKPEDGYDVGPYDGADGKGRKFLTALARGVKTALLYGTTAYVGVAKVKDYSDASNARVRRAATAESAAVWGGIAAGVSGLVTNDLFGAAEEVRDVLTNKPILVSASLGFIGISALSNWLGRRRYQSVETEQVG